MTLSELLFKIQKRLWSILVGYSRNKKVYPYIYRSYWHYNFQANTTKKNTSCYYSARPNPGAGIGHQMANWIAGYWFAKQFGLKFAHLPFSSKKWDDFLGFGKNETKVDDLIRVGFKKRKLPLFDEKNQKEINLINNIIKSYSGNKIVFIAEQDQFYRDQFGVMDIIKKKFLNSNARKNDQLIYDKNKFNIAIHIRRGDIAIGSETQNANVMMRWLNNAYFENVLTNVLAAISVKEPIAIYLFSQGVQEDFIEFEKYTGINFCLDMNAQQSFLHMVMADLLITSKSSFSYKPALLSDGIKVSPKNFWHGYPESKEWILVDDFGNFDKSKITIYVEN